eukprot:370771-Prymnesium_polylepis.1
MTSRSNSCSRRIRRPCVVVAQGGLAPVGVTLSARECDEWCGSRAVCGLVLASPPTWSEMVTAKPVAEATKSYEQLASPLGQLAFGLLEQRAFVRFFSNLFLFGEGTEADERWLDACCAGVRTPHGATVAPPSRRTRRGFSAACPRPPLVLIRCTRAAQATADARPPIFAFNAGLLQTRSYEVELRDLPQPTLVLSGESDKRVADRQRYRSEMRAAALRSLPGGNVLPWEAPRETAAAISAFCAEVGR